jgi:hypothetical protein
MNDRDKEKLVGHPSDYGSRTLGDAEQEQRTADGEPRVERGTADSAISHEAQDVRSDDLQGDTDFEKTNAEGSMPD